MLTWLTRSSVTVRRPPGLMARPPTLWIEMDSGGAARDQGV